MRSLLKPFCLLILPAAASFGQVSFSKDIAPVIAAKCVQCHGSASQMSDLDLRTAEGLAKGGKHGAAVVAGKPEESRLYRHLTGQQQPQMPFGSRLTDAQIGLFKSWIEAGATWEASPLLTSSAASSTTGAPAFSAMQKRYWFFQPVAKPALSSVDAFLNAKLAEKKIRMNAKADKVTLLRRATLDLTGLPPTPEETQAFVADTSAEAFAKVVDRLLASPHYGERWGRMWLDVARYADSNGFKADEFRPNIWRYRDYVIDAFNNDKPYDRFIKEQLAGDVMYPGNLEAKIATGFLRHYTDETNQPSMELRRSELLNNVTDTTAAAFMGLTFGCAKCHDHKFDPILQKDYYKLQAFFSNIRPEDQTVLLTGEALAKYNQQMAEYEAKAAPIRAEMHALVATFAQAETDYYMPRFSAGTQAAIRTPEAERTPFQKLLAFHGMPQITHTDESFAKKLKPAEKKHFDELASQLKALEQLKPKAPMAQTMVENGPDAPPTFVLAAGSWMAPKEEVKPGFLTILNGGDADLSQGRRAALANWLADAKNPMTARVMANRIWQGHFGTGIVASSNDFGIAGERPSNQALLDYLATSLTDNGWSMKKLHRQIMLSNAYQASSASTEASATVDPDNKLLWRYPRHRVEGEVLRDAMLLTSGKLNPQVGGPGMRPELPAGVNAVGYSAWPVEKDEAEANRRSIYVVVKRILTYPMFEAFDAPSTEESCARRFATVVPSQALTMMNDKLVLDWSQALAARVLNDPGLEPAQQIERAFRLTFSRAPKAEEVKTVQGFLEKQTTVLSARLAKNEKVLLPENMPKGMDPAKAAAFVDFCHTLMSSNEFMYIN